MTGAVGPHTGGAFRLECAASQMTQSERSTFDDNHLCASLTRFRTWLTPSQNKVLAFHHFTPMMAPGRVATRLTF